MESGRILMIWWYWVKQSTSKYDVEGDSMWLACQGEYASSTGIIWCWMILPQWKEILKIELQKYMAEKKILEKSSSGVYNWYTCYRWITS